MCEIMDLSAIRKLRYYESIIDKLLVMDEPISLVTVHLLERKIQQLEELVFQLPDEIEMEGEEEREEIMDDWTQTVVTLWERLFTLSQSCDAKLEVVLSPTGRNTEDTQDETVIRGNVSAGGGASYVCLDGGDVSRPSQMSQIAPVVASTQRQARPPPRGHRPYGRGGRGGPPLNGGRGNYREIGINSPPRRDGQFGGQVRRGRGGNAGFRGPPFRSMNFRRTASQTDLLITGPLTKESITVQMGAATDTLASVEDLSDLAPMQSLLTLVAKAATQLSAYRTDTQLQNQLLARLLPKLPADIVARFNHQVEVTNECSLHLLKKHLISELTAHYNSLKEEAAMAAAAAYGSSMDEEEAPNGGGALAVRMCYYCKEPGHLSFQCQQARLMQCFKCFKTGHKAKDCGRRCFKCGRFGHFQVDCRN